MGYTRDEKTGLYNIKGNTYQKIRGSRTQVMNGTAYMTTGELTKNQLVYTNCHYLLAVFCWMLKQKSSEGTTSKNGSKQRYYYPYNKMP